MGKYTPKPEPELEKLIDAGLNRIAAAAMTVPGADKIEAIILGGGYGRGEGGVFRENGSPRPYNDFDLFVLTRNLSRRQRKKIDVGLRDAVSPLAAQYAVHIDFGAAVNISELEKMPFTMMWQELKRGHLVIYGPPDVLASLPEFDLARMPQEEGAKLLLNRGTGLWMAGKILGGNTVMTPQEADFVIRNIWKAVLACGDAWLIAHGIYAFRQDERRHLLLTHHPSAGVPGGLTEWYSRAAEFKMYPATTPENEIRNIHPAVLSLFRESYLDFFSCYYRETVPDMRTLQRLILTREPPDNKITGLAAMKNILLNLYYLGIPSGGFAQCFRYPRFILFAVLPGLLFDSDSATDYIVIPHGLGRRRETTKDAYMRLWSRFN